MKTIIPFPIAAGLLCAFVHTAAAAPPQDTAPPATQTAAPVPPPQAPAESPKREKPKHVSVGLRVRAFPAKSLSVMSSQTLLTTTTPGVVRDWNFVTTSHSSFWGVGPAVEVAINPNFTITAEVLYDRLSYTKVTNIYWGTQDPTTTTDTRTHMIRNEETRARLFDLPLLFHYRGLRSTGLLSRMYLAAGGAVRTVSSIRSNNTITFPDTSKTSNVIPVVPSRRTIVGAVVGVGFRVVDDFNMKTTPEVRYTRWAGSTFGSDSTQSPRNQLEVGVAFTF